MFGRSVKLRVLAVTLGIGTMAAIAIAAGEPTETDEPTPPSAEQVLKEMMDSHEPAQPLLPVEPGRPVRSAVTTQPANPAEADQQEQDLLIEGYDKRTGRLVYDGQWWTLVSEGVGQQQNPPRPIRLLPNRWLETMEAISDGGTRPMLFTVTGEVTEYRGMNYLLIRNGVVKHNYGNLSK